MRECLSDVVKTLESPEAIYLGSKKTHFAYRYAEKRGKFIMVLYHRGTRQGRVKTAYATSDPYSIVADKIKVYPR